MIVAGSIKRISAAVVTVALLAIGALVSSGLLVPLLVIALLVVLFRRRAHNSPMRGAEAPGKAKR